MEYIGEHPLPGQLGNFFVALGFAAALLAVFATFLSLRKNNSPETTKSWEKLGTNAYITSAVSSFIFIGLMLYLLVVQYFEYEYVWEQSNSKMSFKYILVTFWGGQRGSFMLWLFWHCVMGLLMLRVNKELRTGIIFVFALLQTFIISMMLGIYVGDVKIGINPFALLREGEGLGFLWRQIPEYLQLDPTFKDGQGLNPLLQNYWMIIHPPTLFLGFASTTVPFAFAVSALWKKDYTGWLKPVLPWIFFSVAILGLGILMGGAWAYESLSFGGFWGWDPVENASFVPWLTLVGAAHLVLVNKNNPKSLYSALFLTVLTYMLVLYSSFLTRSGILGDSSVHSFTGAGIFYQLLIFLVFFCWFGFLMLMVDRKYKLVYASIGLVLLFFSCIIDPGKIISEQGNFKLTMAGLIALVAITVTLQMLIVSYLKFFPKADKEEEVWTREFFVFIGSLVLALAALIVIFNTSLDVINKLFNTSFTLIEQAERNAFYNKWITPFAIIVCFLAAQTQFLKYKTGKLKDFVRKVYPGYIISIAVTFAFGFFLAMPFQYNLLLFASVFAITANSDYWMRILKGKLNHAGASVAHIGFGLLMLGALISQNKQEILSKNYKGYDLEGLDSEKDPKKKSMRNSTDIQLFKGDTVAMADYFICFTNKIQEGPNQYYFIDYYDTEPRNYRTGEMVELRSVIYRCKKNHTASSDFISDSKNWEWITQPTKQEFFAAKTWLNTQPGKKIFTLTPFIQLNAMNNVSEPGTKHFVSYDIFTHIKYADLSPEDDGKMEQLSYTAKPGDTVGTAGFIMLVKDVNRVTDSLNPLYQLDSSFKVTVLDLIFYDRRDFSWRFPCRATPVFVEKTDGSFAGFPDTIPEMGLLAEVKSAAPFKDTVYVTPGSKYVSDTGDTLTATGNFFVRNSKKYAITVNSREFIVLHAIRFPWINVLWIGCIIMFLGTMMAVVYRIRGK